MAERKGLPVFPILITIAATFVLTVGSFFGCGRTFMGGNQALNQFFFFSFFVFAVSCAVSLIWLVFTLSINFYRRIKGGQ